MTSTYTAEHHVESKRQQADGALQTGADQTACRPLDTGQWYRAHGMLPCYLFTQNSVLSSDSELRASGKLLLSLLQKLWLKPLGQAVLGHCLLHQCLL